MTIVSTYAWRQGRVQCIANHNSKRAAADALPSGAYSTFRTYSGGRVLRLNAHLDRLVESLTLMGHPQALNRAQARAIVREALAASRHPLSRLRLTFAHAAGAAQGDFFVTVEPFEPYPASLYEAGVACVTVSLRRENPHAKSTVFGAQATAAYAQLPEGVHEGLLIADDGSVLEGMSSNFFAILPDASGDAVLVSEEARVLMGTTRALVLECADGLVRYQSGAVLQTELPLARECFITSVSREIMPVVRVDEKPVGDGIPGPLTRALMARFAALVEREAEAL
jgi:branched-chain amino acid aminotransferase